MHDFHGKPLAVGDEVVIPCRVLELHATEEFCNVKLETVLGRRPDGQKETFSAINTGQVIKVEEIMVVQPATPDGDHATEPVIVGDPVVNVHKLGSDEAPATAEDVQQKVAELNGSADVYAMGQGRRTVVEPTAADLDECAREAGEKTDDEA